MKAYAFYIAAANQVLIIPIIAESKTAAFEIYQAIKRNSQINITFLKYQKI